jgi:hypothetical protein
MTVSNPGFFINRKLTPNLVTFCLCHPGNRLIEQIFGIDGAEEEAEK